MKKSNLADFWNKFKRKAFPHQKLIKISFLIIVVIFCLRLGWLVMPELIKLIQKTLIGPKMAYSLFTADTSSLDSFNNRTNILILGIAGGRHEEVDLTDTIIFTSIDKSNSDTVMLSIPRDIWLPQLQTKINTTYHYGEEKEPGGGFALAKDAAYQILNQPIHYAVLIDFEGFIKMVDLLNGIDLQVERSFDDYKYPIPGKERDECDGDPEYKCRYEHLHFDSGLQYFDGITALKFVRSRNAEGEEGTDFARSQRQQKVIAAIASKLFSLKTLFSPKKIMELKNNFGDHIKTDTQFNENQLTAFLSLFLRYIKNKNQIRTISLDWGDKESPGFLINPKTHESGQWVLIPRIKDWTEIQKYVSEKIYKGY